MTLGERVKYVRKSNKMNQIDFAKALGISQTHVSKIEKDIEHPSETLLRFTSYMFAVNIEWLKTGEGSYNKSHEGLKGEFDEIRQDLEVLMKNMNEHQTLDFLDSFRDFLAIYSTFCDEKKGVDDTSLEAFENVLSSIFVLGFHAKTTDDIYCNRQITLLQDSIDKFVTAVLKK